MILHGGILFPRGADSAVLFFRHIIPADMKNGQPEHCASYTDQSIPDAQPDEKA